MNMSKKNYEKFKGFCDYVLETANDEQVEFLMAVLADAAEYAAEQCQKQAERIKRNNSKN